MSASEPTVPPAAPDDLPTTDRWLQSLEREAARDRRSLRISLLVAVVVHVVLLLVSFPQLIARPDEFAGGAPRQVFVVERVRFRPPPPKPAKPQKPKVKTKRIPIPDPTPDDPEPIEVAEIEVPEVEIPDTGDLFGIPEGVPSSLGSAAPGIGDPLHVGGDVRPPRKIFSPQPLYTEEARLSRIQGVVLLQAVIDQEGTVRQLEVVKGLSLGLTESALETVATWKFEPATKNGKAVPVYFNLAVNFRLQ